MNATIRELLAEHGSLPVSVETLANDADLYEAGLSSFASVQVMLALEEHFDIEFPDTMLNRKSFATIAAITACVATLCGDQEAAQ
ncbi:acyl carrier protein [Breoghania corrubedonensis]|uniref:Acyl carrier protein n=1 Tax=Breoghania corrubedonensis TaxID=665038 RepID=A0A2T5VG46_9HYPH|nr:acyl carrier protein [Breoghania corrubedonensis]PTW62725.1 acyl carrier protein [Breoghania corrubedonensis]